MCVAKYGPYEVDEWGNFPRTSRCREVMRRYRRSLRANGQQWASRTGAREGSGQPDGVDRAAPADRRGDGDAGRPFRHRLTRPVTGTGFPAERLVTLFFGGPYHGCYQSRRRTSRGASRRRCASLAAVSIGGHFTTRGALSADRYTWWLRGSGMSQGLPSSVGAAGNHRVAIHGAAWRHGDRRPRRLQGRGSRAAVEPRPVHRHRARGCASPPRPRYAS